MMKAKSFGLYLSIVILAGVFVLVKTPFVYGEENSEDTQSGFTVEPIQPDTQIDKTKSYYFVKVKPGEKQTLKLKVISTTEKAKKVSIEIQSAYTNRSGRMDYTANDTLLDPSLKDSVKEIVQPSEKSVTVKKSEEKIITLTITPPKEAFEGVKIGSVAVVGELSENEGGIQSAVGFNVGIILQEDDTVYNAGDELEIGRIVPQLINQQKYIVTVFRNPIPYILEDLMIETKLTQKGVTKAISEEKTKDLRMAPHSNFEYRTDWGKEDIKAGEYTMYVNARSGDQTWEWTKDFEVTEKQAKEMNKKSTAKLQFPQHFLVGIGCLSVITLGILLTSVQVTRRKKVKEGVK